MKMNDLYKEILRFAGISTDTDGYASIDIYDSREPWLIKGRRVVLPTAAHLKQPEPDSKIIFHPLSEDIMRGESDVIEKLKRTINVRLNSAIGVIAQSLIHLIISPKLHAGLEPEQTDLLIAVKDADAKTLDYFITHMLTGMKKSPDRLFVNIYLKKGGTIHGRRYHRTGIVTFPFYKEVITESSSNLSSKIRVKDKKAFKDLFEFLFPGIAITDQYNYGGNSNTAPYLETLMKTAANIAARINTILDLFENEIESSESIRFNSDWLTYFDNLDIFTSEIRAVPMQAGNEGAVPIDPSRAVNAETPIKTPELIAPTAISYPSLLAPPAAIPDVRPSGQAIDFSAVRAANPMLTMLPNPLQSQINQQIPIQRQFYQPGIYQPALPVNYPNYLPQPNYTIYQPHSSVTSANLV